jgi:hypothetical protein
MAVPFLDVLILAEHRGTQTWLRTEPYDKRTQPAFHGIPLTRFIWYHSSVNTGARNNIFASQFHRLRHRITAFSNFIAELAVIMGQLHCRGFPMPRLWRSLRRLWEQNPHVSSVERHQ